MFHIHSFCVLCLVDPRDGAVLPRAVTRLGQVFQDSLSQPESPSGSMHIKKPEGVWQSISLHHRHVALKKKSFLRHSDAVSSLRYPGGQRSGIGSGRSGNTSLTVGARALGAILRSNQTPIIDSRKTSSSLLLRRQRVFPRLIQLRPIVLVNLLLLSRIHARKADQSPSQTQHVFGQVIRMVADWKWAQPNLRLSDQRRRLPAEMVFRRF